MWLRCLGFALLLWIPGELHAQSAQKPCSAPSLDKGFCLPVQESYPHETHITYACDNGYKPIVEGWWATITCQNGTWSHDPQCIDETACVSPTIPNAKNIQSSSVIYKNGQIFEIKCNKGYVSKKQQNSPQCKNGTWISVPICEKSPTACREPPNIPNAVIIHQKHQEVFDMGSEVEYQCRDGYVTQDKNTKKSISCNNGTWTEGPLCKPPSSSMSDEDDIKPPFVPIENCGKVPQVPNGEQDKHENIHLKYTCGYFYKLEGPEIVVCQSNGEWSEIPTCRDDFCEINTAEHPDLINVGVKSIKNGKTEQMKCKDVYVFPNYSVVKCNNGKLEKSACCNTFQINTGVRGCNK
ncbi:complement factor H-related protein 1 [Nematolebias whitei]|uniref:complement factor H-related protein 1 n=1 Tax=Nematolebias whitei TaxID=451745 RepID=UPI001897203B|nr:complement factor H-related protein 1 [Nematolebias whitei]